MPGTIGNTNAEKWTEEKTLELLGEMEKSIKTEGFVYLGDLLVRFGLYKQVWTYWQDKFKDNDIVLEPIKRIDTHFESQLFKQALKNEVNSTVAIFGLKNNHNWKDKTVNEHTGEDGGPIRTEIKHTVEYVDYGEPDSHKTADE